MTWRKVLYCWGTSLPSRVVTAGKIANFCAWSREEDAADSSGTRHQARQTGHHTGWAGTRPGAAGSITGWPGRNRPLRWCTPGHYPGGFTLSLGLQASIPAYRSPDRTNPAPRPAAPVPRPKHPAPSSAAPASRPAVPTPSPAAPVPEMDSFPGDVLGM